MDPLASKLMETLANSGSGGRGSGGVSSTSGGTRQSAPRPATNGTSERFVLIPAGTYSMGSDNGDSDEKPVHQVTINKAFFMSDHEVTQKEWVETMGTTIRQQRDMEDKSLSLYGDGDNYPMYYVNWYEAIEYCNKRSIKEGLMPAYSGSGDDITCNFKAGGYRLPTEAEWEWAAKGGRKDFMIYEYSGSNSVDGVAWYSGNSGNRTHPVKTKTANSLGLYDMSGNVWEWCWDWYESYKATRYWDWYGRYGGSAQTSPVGAAEGSYRVVRGGSWCYFAQNVRSTFRFYGIPSYRDSDLGFRLVRQ